ncbi:hypothetical protein ACQ4PT_055287 [Festuca glaucescens]
MMEVRASSDQQGVMAGREPFGLPNSPPTPPSSGPMHGTMRMAYGPDGTPFFAPVSSAPPPTETYQPVGGGAPVPDSAAAGGNGSPAFLVSNMDDSAKKKRGRPRKYGDDGSMALALVPVPNPAEPAPGTFGPFSPPAMSAAGTALGVAPVGMKKRGRPKGSTNKPKPPPSPLDFIALAGAGFTAHVLHAQAGEDVAAKIMAFSQQGTRGICVLSANGAISNVSLRQAATSGGTATYEGRFEILSLSGSFLVQEMGGHRTRTGGLSVSLAGPDGRVLGGGVAGVLIACTPIQIVVGSFSPDTGEKKAKKQQAPPSEPASAPPKLAPIAPVPIGVGMGPSSPPSRGTLSESSGGPGSPMNQGGAATATASNSNNSQQGGLSSMSWK